MMERLRQGSLNRMTQWPIFTSKQLDYNGKKSTNLFSYLLNNFLDFHQPSTADPKDLIEKYRLHHSILHFQIFFIDTNHVAYPTDLSCETGYIFEYDGKI